MDTIHKYRRACWVFPKVNINDQCPLMISSLIYCIASRVHNAAESVTCVQKYSDTHKYIFRQVCIKMLRNASVMKLPIASIHTLQFR